MLMRLRSYRILPAFMAVALLFGGFLPLVQAVCAHVGANGHRHTEDCPCVRSDAHAPPEEQSNAHAGHSAPHAAHSHSGAAHAPAAAQHTGHHAAHQDSAHRDGLHGATEPDAPTPEAPCGDEAPQTATTYCCADPVAAADPVAPVVPPSVALPVPVSVTTLYRPPFPDSTPSPPPDAEARQRTSTLPLYVIGAAFLI